jgi:hypothetical protein
MLACEPILTRGLTVKTTPTAHPVLHCHTVIKLEIILGNKVLGGILRAVVKVV